MDKRALFAQRMGLTAITNIAIALSGVILLPILTRTLTIEEYGTWSLVLITLGLVPNVTSLGLSFSLVRFSAGSANRQEIQETVYSIALVVLLTSLIASGLFLLFARQIAATLFNNDLTAALLLAPNIFVACLNYVLPNYFRAFQQMKRYSFLNFGQTFLNVALVGYFVFSGYGLQGALIGLLIQQLIVLFVTVYFMWRALGTAIPRFTKIRTYLGFGVPLVVQGLSGWTVNSSDRYLIGILLSTAAVGYYSPAYTIGSTIILLAYPFAQMLPPVLTKHYEEGNLGEVRAVLRYSLKYYCGVAIPCVFALSVLSKPLLTVLSTNEIAANGYLVTPIVALSGLLFGTYQVILQGIALKKKTPLIASIWMVSAGLNFGLNLIIIPYWGIIGAALTTLLAYSFAFVVTTVYSLRYLKFDVNAGFILKSVAASIVGALFLVLWNPLGLPSILLGLTFSAAIYLSIVFILKGFTTEEIRFFLRIFTRT